MANLEKTHFWKPRGRLKDLSRTVTDMYLKTCLDPLQVRFGTHLVTQNRSRNGLEAILKGIRNRILILVAKRSLGGAMICTQNPTPLPLPSYMYSRALRSELNSPTSILQD